MALCNLRHNNRVYNDVSIERRRSISSDAYLFFLYFTCDRLRRWREKPCDLSFPDTSFAAAADAIAARASERRAADLIEVLSTMQPHRHSDATRDDARGKAEQ